MAQPEQHTSAPVEMAKVPLWQLRQLAELIGKIEQDDGGDHALLCASAAAMVRHMLGHSQHQRNVT